MHAVNLDVPAVQQGAARGPGEFATRRFRALGQSYSRNLIFLHGGDQWTGVIICSTMPPISIRI